MGEEKKASDELLLSEARDVHDRPAIHSTNNVTGKPRRFHVTRFPDIYAETLAAEDLSLEELRSRVLQTNASAKEALPWLKLARFGNKRTEESNCLRHDENVLKITGVEVDYDEKSISFDEAVTTIKAAGLNALVYTSPSHSAEKPKWRIVLPTSQEWPPNEKVETEAWRELKPKDRAKCIAKERGELVAAVNGLFGGTLSSESFTLSQSFYYGSVNHNGDHRAVVVDGDFIDKRGDLSAGAIWKATKGNGADDEADTGADWEKLVREIQGGAPLHESTRDLAATLIASGMSDGATVNLLRGLMLTARIEHDARWQERYDDIPRAVRSAWEKFRREKDEIASRIHVIDKSRWDFEPVPQQEWAVPDRVPLLTTALFSGEGGAGKSLITLQLCFAHARGANWLRSMPRKGPALFLDAEDPEGVIHKRLADIVDHHGCKFADTKDLHLVSLAGEDAVLGAFNRKTNRIEPTARFHRLHEMVGDLKPTMIGIGAAADVFAGNEIDRSQVQQFISLLTKLAILAQGSVVLIAHPSLTGISTDTGLSGSTQWHNSVRARIYLKGVKPENGEEPDKDLRLLEFKKNNYGPVSESVPLRYENGLFLPVTGETIDQAVRDQQVDEVYLRVLQTLHEQNQDVGPSPGPNYAPALIARHTAAKGCTKKELVAAQQRLLDINRIHVREVGPPSRSRKYIVPGGAA
jgi:RecA-family ATPase